MRYVLLVFVLVACAPATVSPVVRYEASPQDIINELATHAPSVQSGPGVNYFRVEAISEKSITLLATLRPGAEFFSNEPLRVTFTTFEAEGITTLAYSVNLNVGADAWAQQHFYNRLDTKFKRL